MYTFDLYFHVIHSVTNSLYNLICNTYTHRFTCTLSVYTYARVRVCTSVWDICVYIYVRMCMH